MADLAANIGANFSNYVGSPNLGGGVDVGILNIDTKPIEDFGKYTMLYNKAAQEQRQKDAEEQAKQLASITAYDLTTAIPKDRELITKGYNELVDYARQNPTVLDYKNNPSGWLEYNKKKADFENQLKSAKTRSILYKVREDEIAKNTNPEMKAILGRNLQDEVASTDIFTPLKATQQYDLTVPEIPTPQIKSFDVTVIGDNENIKRDYSVLDMKDVKSKASAVTLGMLGMELDETSPSFLAKTPEEQKLLRAQAEQRKAGKGLLPVEQANQFNAAIQQYMNMDEPGQIDIEAIKAKNPMLYGIIQQYDNRNAYVKSIADQIRAGTFKDKLGNPVVFGPNGLNEADYQPISYTDGITPEEIVELQIMGKAKPDTYKTTVQETDNKLQAEQLKQKTINDAENRAIERAKLAQTKKEWDANVNGSESVRNGAWKYGQDIVAQLKKVSTGGFIFPDKFGKLNNEILMALGSERPAVPAVRDENGKILQSEQPAGFYPLELAPGNAIKIDGDNVLIYNNKGEFSASPKFSTSLANIATNRLLREVKAASGKEIGLFSGVDQDKAPVVVSTEKTKTASGSSASVKAVVPVETYTTAELKGAGWSDAQINQAVKEGKIKIK